MKKSLLLSIFAAAGVIVTAIVASKAGEEAAVLKMDFQKQREIEIPEKARREHLETELVDKMLQTSKAIERKKLWRIYFPSVVTAVGTIACIILGYRYQAKLLAATSSYAALESSKLRKYRTKVREICPEGTDEKIIAELAKDDLKMYPALPEDEAEGTKLFYDYYTQRFFRATPSRVREAAYHLNRNFTLGWTASPNDLYDMIGIEKIPFCSNVHWYADWMMDMGFEGPWINVLFQDDVVDGKDCTVMFFEYDPITEEEYEEECG